MELGGGLALTGGAYVPAEGGITSTNRWLRFDFNDPNHKSLVILGGTSFTIGENIVTIDETTSYNLSDYISEEGADYYVFINADGRVIASQIRTPADGYMFIGQFHTLCNSVPANQTSILATSNTVVGTNITQQHYDKNSDLDFYNFYNKPIDAIATGSYYNVATILHVLAGFNAKDILPESVWCLNFHPSCKNWDGMVYCNDFKLAIDIYFQSGTGESTGSYYGSVVTGNRLYMDYLEDLMCVGKKFMRYDEWISTALGCVEKSYAKENYLECGAHLAQNNFLLISSIGVADAMGLRWTLCWADGYAESNSWYISDGQGSFGYCRDNFAFVDMGCPHNEYGYATYAGHRCMGFDNFVDNTGNYMGVRGCCDISIV